MTIAAIGAVEAVAGLARPDAAQAGIATPPAGNFGSWFTGELNTVNAALVRSDVEVRQLATGEGPPLHEVMIHLEEAKLSFQLLAQVRNHLLEAYQEVMKTQV